MEDITIVIADDHPIFRKGLRDILEEDASFRVVAECADGEEALNAIRELRPDVAILDLEMPKMNGLDVAAVVQRDHLPTAVIMLTISDRIEMFNHAMEYGMVGYILKEVAATELVDAIHTVLRGSYYISASLATRAVTKHTHSDTIPHIASGLALLTATERKILRFIGEDKSSTDIAAILNISARTVDTHRSNIAEKLNLHGSYALVRFALQNKDVL